jgi:UPF0755 protein
MLCRCRAESKRLVWLAALALSTAGCGEPYGAPIRVVVPPGASFQAAAESLAQAGVIGSPKLFRTYASVMGRDRSLKPGTYLLQRGTAWSEVMDALTSGRGIVRTVTIPEGFALSSIVPLLAKALGTPVDSVRAAVSDTALRRRLDIPTPTLEGYLFPATYGFPDGTSASDAVAQLVQRFEQSWKPEWDARLQQLAMSRHDIVTLASIIEKEARLAEERPVISAVYHNRLKAGMLLQADPTVQYAQGRHVERVMYKDLEIDSRYNTYRYPGLPPGPIASPGAPSLEAALFPADVPFLFFVAHPDGHHEFRRTFDEHEEARAQIRRSAGADGRRR